MKTIQPNTLLLWKLQLHSLSDWNIRLVKCCLQNCSKYCNSVDTYESVCLGLYDIQVVIFSGMGVTNWR